MTQRHAIGEDFSVSILTVLRGNTVDDWFSYCREVCLILNDNHWRDVKLGDSQGEIVENQKPQRVVQIDESLLRGRRKYNRGRLLAGNKY